MFGEASKQKVRGVKKKYFSAKANYSPFYKVLQPQS